MPFGVGCGLITGSSSLHGAYSLRLTTTEEGSHLFVACVCARLACCPQNVVVSFVGPASVPLCILTSFLGVVIRPVLKHGPRSLTYVRVIRC